MTIREIYDLAVKKGVETDFRGISGIEDDLKRRKEKYEKLSEDERGYFDKERLSNPFADSRILFGDPNKEVKKMIAGIDIEGGEIFLAKELSADLIFSHHPEGIALAGLDDVMHLQIDVLAQYGVPINVAEKLLRKRISEVSRSLSPANHNRVVDLAKALNIPIMCGHTVCDNRVARFVEEKITKDNPQYLEGVMKSLMEIPEYREAAKMGAGPKIFVGDSDNRAGKIVFTEITGGTEGAPEIYEKLAQAGAGTVIGMHISEKHREEAEKANINVVIAGHISSDSIGVNLLMDDLEKAGIEIVAVGGLIRHKRI